MSISRINRGFSRRSLLLSSAGLAASTAFHRVHAQTPIAWPAATPVVGDNVAPVTGIERDEIVIGMYSLPSTYEPAVGNNNPAEAMYPNNYETLVRRDSRNGNVLVPHLATQWMQETDTSMVFRLRENVAFHNGEIMTADDVVYSFERILESGPDSKFAGVKSSFIQTIASVEAIDDLTVRFTTHLPDPALLGRLSVVPSFIVNRKFTEEMGEDEFAINPNGTGPYKVVSFQPESEIVMERHEDYWGGMPNARTATFRLISEVASRLTALANSEVQIANSIAPDQVESITTSGTNTTRSIPLANAYTVAFNEKAPGLADKRLRRALTLAIDRALIIEAIFLGQATHMREFQFEDFGPLYDETRQLTEYNLDLARQLVEESDYNDELISYQLVPGYYLNNDLTGQVIVEAWQSIGVNAEIQLNDAFMLDEENMSAHTWSASNYWGDPAGGYWRQFGEGGFMQGFAWTAPEEFNAIGIEAQQEMDVARRKELYGQLTDIWVEEAPATDLHAIDNIAGVETDINWEPNPVHAINLHPINLSFNK